MRLSRRFIRWLSGSLVVVLLAVQFATAAYACPKRALPDAGATAMMPGCDGTMSVPMEAEQPLLCQAHCQQGTQTVHPTPVNDAPASPVLLAVLDWTAMAWQPLRPEAHPSWSSPGASPPGSPPRYLSLQVLRN